MNIPKAIKVLEDILKYVKPGDPPEEHNAIKLGIEALRRIQRQREDLLKVEIKLLPGETQD